jgi:hypothetical protein
MGFRKHPAEIRVDKYQGYCIAENWLKGHPENMKFI